MLGVKLDVTLNDADNPQEISPAAAKVAVRVLVADENGTIARHVAQLSR